MAGNPDTYCLPLNRRMNQYDLWPGFQDLIGYNAIFAAREDKNSLAVTTKYLEAAFDHCEKKEIAISTKLGIIKYDVLRCYDFKGMPPWHVESF